MDLEQFKALARSVFPKWKVVEDHPRLKVLVRHQTGKPQVGFSSEFIRRATPLEANAKMEKWLLFFSKGMPDGLTDDGGFYEDGVD